MNVGSLVVRLGVVADTMAAKTFNRSIKDIPISAMAAVSSLAGLSLTFAGLTKNALDTTNQLSLFQSQTDLSTNELQRWQNVAKQAGISGDAVAQSVMGINNALARADLGDGGALKSMGLLGLNVNEQTDPFQLLEQLRQTTKTMQKRDAMILLHDMGVSPDMMRIFSMGDRDFERMKSVSPTQDQSTIKALQGLQEALAKMAITIEQSFTAPLKELLPYMKDIAQALSVILPKLFGGAAYGVGESSRLFNEINRQGGVANFLENVLKSYDDQDTTKSKGKVVNQNITINNNGVKDPAEVGAEVAAQVERMAAMDAFGNQGTP